MQHFDVLNGVVTMDSDSAGRPYDRRTKPRMRKLLGLAQRGLISAPVSSAIVATVSAIDVWRATADELGRRIHESISTGAEMCDPLLHNQLLIAGYFWACNLANEGLVGNELSRLSSSMLSIQGTLVDIVERVSPQGIDDQRLTIVTRTGPFTLQHQTLSPLLDALVCESKRLPVAKDF